MPKPTKSSPTKATVEQLFTRIHKQLVQSLERSPQSLNWPDIKVSTYSLFLGARTSNEVKLLARLLKEACIRRQLFDEAAKFRAVEKSTVEYLAFRVDVDPAKVKAAFGIGISSIADRLSAIPAPVLTPSRHNPSWRTRQ